MKRNSRQEDPPPSLFPESEAHASRENAPARRSATSAAPLATRMRPLSLDEYVGQAHLLGEKGVLRQAITMDRIPSMVLWGPPGSGKTSLAAIIGRTAKAKIASLSAVSAGVADLRKVVEEAQARLELTGRHTILFIDEIHRFSKNQQDAILPYVEDGTVTLIGATTENPSFEVNAPLLSRTRVYKLEPLTESEIEALVTRCLKDSTRGLGDFQVDVQPEALKFLVRMANGDARVALNALELAVTLAKGDETGQRSVTEDDISKALQRRALPHDKKGDSHYDLISAYIKSVRGSDPDAAVYWLARMIEGGEGPALHRASDGDSCFRRHRPRRPARDRCRCCRPAGGAFHWYARGNLPTDAGNALPCHGAEEQFGATGLRRGAGRHSGNGQPQRTAPSAQRAYRPDGGLWTRARTTSIRIRLRRTGWRKNTCPNLLQGQRFYEPGTVGFERTVKERLEEHGADTEDSASASEK